jgi:hypothetical protein
VLPRVGGVVDRKVYSRIAVQFMKAPAAIEVSDAGSSISVNREQPPNAKLFTLVTFCKKLTEGIELQLFKNEGGI